ncbi:MAG TPA: hypothetical protein VFL03_06045 [Candidatus Limnocylindrales bacterium]|nr:hypothetical protein [Candidatus Limnocylindrales bacterium]
MHITTTRGARLRRGLALAALPLTLVVAACGAATPSAPAATDAYQVTSKVFDAPLDRVKVNVGVTTTGSEAIEIKPDAIQLIVDTKAGKGSVHLSLPSKALGSEGASLGALGGGDTIDIDAVFDGQGLYVKSPLAATVLPLLAMQGVQVPTGDLTGWLKLGTAEELGGLMGAIGDAKASADPGDLKNLSPEDLKKQLEDAGVTVTVVGREQRNGVDSDHLLLNVDLKKLEASDLGKQVPSDQLGALGGAAANGTLTADVWLDAANGRPNEIALHAADGSDKAEIQVLISDPGDVSLDAPASFLEIPVAPLLAPLMQSFGGALGSPSP